MRQNLLRYDTKNIRNKQTKIDKRGFVKVNTFVVQRHHQEREKAI